MDPILQSIESIDFLDSERPLLNVLKATLQYPANPQAKGAKLADDINFFCNSVEEGVGLGKILWEVWPVVIDIACCIPPGHPWQDSLVRALESLRHQDNAVPTDNEVRCKQPSI